jgi:hypothetical protein
MLIAAGHFLEKNLRVGDAKVEGAKGSLDGGDPVRFEYGVPAKYTGYKTSGLSVTIPDTGKRDINLTLSSK